MTKLLTHGVTTAVSTLAGSTALAGEYSSGVRKGPRIFQIDKINVECAGTTIQPDSTEGLVMLRYGDSSDVGGTTMAVMLQPFRVGGGPTPFSVELSDLGIKCKWFQFITLTTSQGVNVHCFGV